MIRSIIRGGYAKLLHRVERDREHGREGVRPLIIGRDTIDRDVALIAARAVDRPVSCIEVPVIVKGRAVAGIKHTCLKAEQIRNVAAFER